MSRLTPFLQALGLKRRRGRAYQEKLAGSLVERCRQIEGAIPNGAATVLDIGCNLGDLTAWCARRGLWSVGIDSSLPLIEDARLRHADASGCAFMHQKLGPGDVARLPVFDVVLLLSVHHHWLMAHGPMVAGEMLRDLAGRTGRVLIFEGASRNVRYGDYPPGFIDNDESSVTGYLRGYLDQHVGDCFSRIEPLGRTACVGEREPWRWAWGLHK
jgi:SAM-dependent methyltransferase